MTLKVKLKSPVCTGLNSNLGHAVCGATAKCDHLKNKDQTNFIPGRLNSQKNIFSDDFS